MGDIEVHGPAVERSGEILTPEALDFVIDLHRRFGSLRDELLAARTYAALLDAESARLQRK